MGEGGNPRPSRGRPRRTERNDLDDQRDGFVRPWSALDTVRRIATDTQAEAARLGHGSADTVDGTVDGDDQAVVLSISWMYLGGERHHDAAEIVQPNDDGRYAIGGHEWCWYALSADLTPMTPGQVKRTPMPPLPEQSTL
ncbi:hypothetical protein [Streptomyces sp900116325]|uniref:hypothetical protein n=1 Tax=Streptomyces sp. 900116325 TaxID=3154295 RepID=UPI0033ADB975